MEKEMERFERAFAEAMSSEVLPMDAMIRFTVSGGKRLRPRLVFLSARLFGEVNEATRRAALFVEMLHTATLIHDDVVDGGDCRRGRASLNARCGSKAAVLAGDFLLAKAMTLLSNPSDHLILKEMLDAAMAMSEGELLQDRRQISEGGRQDTSDPCLLSPEFYLNILERKTARLLRACCVGGAVSVVPQPSPLTIGLLGDFGLNLGLVFQMRDDIIDADDPEVTALAQQLLPDCLDKTLNALEALAPFVKNTEVLEELRSLTSFCAQRSF